MYVPMFMKKGLAIIFLKQILFLIYWVEILYVYKISVCMAINAETQPNSNDLKSCCVIKI